MSDRADRYNTGKPKLSFTLEMPNGMRQLADIYEYGAKKYARGNFKKGLPQTEVIDSLMRHVMAYINGENCDPESGLPHPGHIAWNAMLLAEQFHRTELDDRASKPTELPVGMPVLPPGVDPKDYTLAS